MISLAHKVNKVASASLLTTYKRFAAKVKSHSLYIFGGIGSTANVNVITPTKIPRFGSDPRVKQIIAGNQVSLVLNEERELWAWGNDEKASISTKINKTPTYLKDFQIHRIIKAGVGRAHSIFLSGTGNVFSSGSFEFGQVGITEPHRVQPDDEKKTIVGPQPIIRLNEITVKDICSGYDHSIAITGSIYSNIIETESGELYSWGWNMYGQTGSGDAMIVEEPTLISSLSRVKIDKVYSKTDFNIAITQQGQLYSWGSGFNYTLGTGQIKDVNKPILIPALANKRFISASCAESAAFAISDDNKLYSWGNSLLQLGNDFKTQLVTEPQIFDKLKDEKIVQVSAGHRHVFCVTDKGRLYAWGNNESGQLGVGDTKNREVPTVVEFFEGKRIVAVSGGETHTIVQVEE